MTRRLALLYALSASVVLVGTGATAYWWLDREIGTDDVAALGGRLAELRGMMQDHVGRAAMQDELAREAVAMRPGHFVGRLITPDGRVAFESPDMPPALAPGVFAPAPGPTDEPSERAWTAGGTSYLLMSAMAPSPDSAGDGRPWIVQVALDRTAEAQIEHEFRDGLLGAIGLGVIALSVLGWMVARRALRPLDELTAATAGIVASRLDQRLGDRASGAPWPSELAALRDAFDAMLARLHESFGRLQQFSADLAHELRTPVAKLRGEAEVVLGRDRTAGEYRAVIESSLEEYSRLSSMIESLLFLARADSGRAALARTPIHLRHEAAAAADFYEPLAECAGITVTIDGDAVVDADPVMVRHAVGNLLANALRHTPASGCVSITIAPAPRGAWIRVSDTGCGIAPEHLPRVFDRFYRSDASRTSAPDAADRDRARQEDGVGLGLALVKSIAELHGGYAEIESEVGRGTTASVFLAAS